jgi:hypothetical protein
MPEARLGALAVVNAAAVATLDWFSLSEPDF